MAKACRANGASQESENPKSPFVTVIKKPPTVARANATPDRAAQSRPDPANDDDDQSERQPSD
jgi:hypothetical protein